jgi:hypothetical protein
MARVRILVVDDNADLSTHEQARLSRSVQAIVRKGHGGIPALLEDLRRFLPAASRLGGMT